MKNLHNAAAGEAVALASSGLETPPKDAVYKEVVVVGNGPSGIALSYMLSGNWPYCQSDRLSAHPDELLRARLDYAGHERSLVQHNLEALADGLEGRSTNPVSLLLDSLQNPAADIGMQLPSMLRYANHPHRRIEHVVLGKGPPGGSWHRMDPNLRTLSLSNWMSLPGYDFAAWEQAHSTGNEPDEQPSDDQTNARHRPCRFCAKHTATADGSDLATAAALSPLMADRTAAGVPTAAAGALPRRQLLQLQRQVSKNVQTRALVSRVAQYYECYVQHMQLAAQFRNDCLVTAVKPLAAGAHPRARWLVQGRKTSGKPFRYLCRNVVLAVGASDLPNRLGVPGERAGHPWIKHELPQLELALQAMRPDERAKLRPVLIIGAGLSAADAVTICRLSGVPVLHVYRSSSVGLDRMLPETVYPEYHAVHKMMKDSQVPYEFYTPLAEHQLIAVQERGSAGGHQVTLLNQKSGETRRFEVSLCAILIGSRPDLRLLRTLNDDRRPARSPVAASGSVYEQIAATLKLLDAPLDAAAARSIGSDAPGNDWLIGRRLAWLKNLCAKCRKLNLCEWSRRKHSAGGELLLDAQRLCECPTPRTTLASLDEKARVRTTLLAERTAGDEAAASAFAQLGEDPLRPIDCKTNPMAVNKYTNEVQRIGQRGMYAMGPLVGDNFVRFIAGGALAITSALHREND